MGQRLAPACVVISLLIGALVLPVVISILLGLSSLLGAMGDGSGRAVLGWIALSAGVLWALDLIALVLVQAINSLGGVDRRDEI